MHEAIRERLERECEAAAEAGKGYGQFLKWRRATVTFTVVESHVEGGVRVIDKVKVATPR